MLYASTESSIQGLFGTVKIVKLKKLFSSLEERDKGVFLMGKMYGLQKVCNSPLLESSPFSPRYLHPCFYREVGFPMLVLSIDRALQRKAFHPSAPSAEDDIAMTVLAKFDRKLLREA